jgi:hypothetical protein
MVVLEQDQTYYDRVRYDTETNLEIWGLSLVDGEFTWKNGGVRSLASASCLQACAEAVMMIGYYLIF